MNLESTSGVAPEVHHPSWKREYRGRYYRQHRVAAYLTSKEQQRCRENISLIREIRSDDVIACPECWILLGTLHVHSRAEHGMSAQALREKHALPNSFRLCSKTFSQTMRKTRGEGLKAAGTATRFKPASSTISQTTVKNKAKRSWQPRATNVTDWEIVECRLRGDSQKKIAEKVNLTQGAVSSRLLRLGFPKSYNGTGLVFYHGEPITRRHLPFLIQDWIAVNYEPSQRPAAMVGSHEQLSIDEAAKRLGVSPAWVHDHARRGRRDPLGSPRGGRIYLGSAQVLHLTDELERIRRDRHEARAVHEITRALRVNPHWITHRLRAKDKAAPLSERIGDRLLTVWKSLKSVSRRQGTSSRGGRPKMLLPSEEAALSWKYPSLLGNLKDLLKWLHDQDTNVSLAGMRAWICAQAKHGRMRTVLFFWPEFFDWLGKGFDRISGRGMNHGMFLAKKPTWRPSDVALDFLAYSYDLAPTTLKDLLKKG